MPLASACVALRVKGFGRGFHGPTLRCYATDGMTWMKYYNNKHTRSYKNEKHVKKQWDMQILINMFPYFFQMRSVKHRFKHFLWQIFVWIVWFLCCALRYYWIPYVLLRFIVHFNELSKNTFGTIHLEWLGTVWLWVYLPVVVQISMVGSSWIFSSLSFFTVMWKLVN